MPAMRIAQVLCLVLAAACARVSDAPPGEAAREVPPAVDPLVTTPQADRAVAIQAPRSDAMQETVAPAPAPVAPPQPAMRALEASANEPVAAATPPSAASPGAGKASAPPARAPAKTAATPAVIERQRKNEAAAPAAKPPEPPLDVESLKARLRDTKAIGVFTKLALKNQVDDLLQQFRTHYQNGQRSSIAALRQAYDMLVLKVLALIQDGDPALARTLSGSREAIWGILADPVKFNSVS